MSQSGAGTSMYVLLYSRVSAADLQQAERQLQTWAGYFTPFYTRQCLAEVKMVPFPKHRESWVLLLLAIALLSIVLIKGRNIY